MRTPGPWHTGGTFFTDEKRPSQNVWGPTPEGMQSGNIVCVHASVPDAKLIAIAPELLRLLTEAKSMAEFGDINADMEDDGIGWKQWYQDVSAILRSQADGETNDKG